MTTPCNKTTVLTIADKDRFVNDGLFFKTHPDVFPWVTSYQRTAMSGELLESWERWEDGRMHDVTRRDRLLLEVAALQADLDALEVRV